MVANSDQIGHLDVFLLEDDLAGVVGDFGGAAVPFDLVERFDLGIAEDPLPSQGIAGRSGTGRGGGAAAGGFGFDWGLDLISSFDHRPSISLRFYPDLTSHGFDNRPSFAFNMFCPMRTGGFSR